jgi:hypothetical protein
MTDKIDLEQFKAWLNSQSNTSVFPVSEGRRKSILGDLNVLFDSNSGRHAFLRWAFDKSSSKELTNNQWYALKEWLGAAEVEPGKWAIRPKCYATAAALLFHFQKEAGQMELIA